MEFWLTCVIALAAGFIGFRCYAKHTPARWFCFLWVATVLVWPLITMLVRWWHSNYAASASYEVISIVSYIEHMAGAALCFCLLHYMRRNNTGFLLIGIPITFYLILGVCVPFEARIFETFYTWELYNAIPMWFALSELFLLVVDQNDNRRRVRRLLANVLVPIHHRNAFQIRNRVD